MGSSRYTIITILPKWSRHSDRPKAEILWSRRGHRSHFSAYQCGLKVDNEQTTYFGGRRYALRRLISSNLASTVRWGGERRSRSCHAVKQGEPTRPSQLHMKNNIISGLYNALRNNGFTPLFISIAACLIWVEKPTPIKASWRPSMLEGRRQKATQTDIMSWRQASVVADMISSKRAEAVRRHARANAAIPIGRGNRTGYLSAKGTPASEVSKWALVYMRRGEMSKCEWRKLAYRVARQHARERRFMAAR